MKLKVHKKKYKKMKPKSFVKKSKVIKSTKKSKKSVRKKAKSRKGVRNVTVTKFIDYFFKQRITIAKWELNLFGLILFVVGLSSGLFFALYNLGVIFAAPTQSSETITAQADFNYGTFSETQSTNTAGGEVELAGGSGPDGTLYFQDIVISSTNTSVQTEYQVLIDGLDTAALVTATKLQADCDDLRFTNSVGTSIPYSLVGKYL